MRKGILFLLTVLAICMVACTTNTTAQENNQEETKEAETTAVDDGKHFGQSIDDAGAVPFGTLVGQLSQNDSLETKVYGTVSAVCQAKGCWMSLVSEGTDQKEMMVRFKDYGFFVPKDISGRKVVLEGKAFREVTSVDELRHYAEDEGKSKEEIEAITEPVEELKFLASGVLLLDEKDQGK